MRDGYIIPHIAIGHWVQIKLIVVFINTAKRRRRVTAITWAIMSVCPSVHLSVGLSMAHGMHTSAPAIMNITIKCGPDSVVDQYTLLEPTKSAFSQH